jgi:hypothetical protein
MDIGIRAEAAAGPLPPITFRWDAETEILAGHFDPPSSGRGLTGAIEYTSPEGAVITVDVVRGVVCGVEVVVWPRTDQRDDLAAPAAGAGQVTVPERPSQPGVGAIEVEAPIAVETTADERTIHLRVGRQRPATPWQVARNMLIELDNKRDIAGFWLLDVPPFPREDA